MKKNKTTNWRVTTVSDDWIFLHYKQPEVDKTVLKLCSITTFQTGVTVCPKDTSYSKQCVNTYNQSLHFKAHAKSHCMESSVKFNPYIYIVKSGVVNNQGDVFTQKKQFIRPNYPCDIGGGNVRETHNVQEVFVISQHLASAIFHFSIESLPRLGLYLNFLLAHHEIKIHVIMKTKLALNYFKALGISECRLVAGEVVADIIYVPQGTQCGALHQPSGVLMRQYYHNVIHTNNSNKNIKRNYIVVIKRSEKRWINESNHLEIIQSLKKIAVIYKLKVVVFDDKKLPSFEDTMMMFYRAVVVVAPHGAGLSNLMFSMPKTLVLEVMCSIYINGCFKDIAISLGHHYHMFVSQSPSCENMVIDVKYIESVLFKFLAYITNRQLDEVTTHM